MQLWYKYIDRSADDAKWAKWWSGHARLECIFWLGEFLQTHLFQQTWFSLHSRTVFEMPDINRKILLFDQRLQVELKHYGKRVRWRRFQSRGCRLLPRWLALENLRRIPGRVLFRKVHSSKQGIRHIIMNILTESSVHPRRGESADCEPLKHSRHRKVIRYCVKWMPC